MNILSIIIFAGGIQGFFLSFTLWIHNRGNKLANKLLALLIFLFCLYLIISEIIRTYPEQFPHLIASTFPILFIIGPLTLLYVTAIRFKNISGQNLYLHFLPAILCLIVLLPFYVKSGEYKLVFYNMVRSQGMSYAWSLLWGASCLHIAIYSYISGRQIQLFKENLKDHYSNFDELNLSWLKKFVLVMSGLWGLYLLLFLVSLTGITIDPYGVVDYIFSISIAIVIFAIGFMAFRKPEVFSEIRESRRQKVIWPMKKKVKVVSFLILVGALLGSCDQTEDNSSDMDKLIVLQKMQRKAHIQKDADLLISMFAHDFRSIDSGLISTPTKEESRNRFQSYFDRVEFLAWDNVEEPIIRISDDGSMAYIIVKKLVHLRHIQARDESKTTFAWLETWEKIKGEWKMKAIASTQTQQ